MTQIFTEETLRNALIEIKALGWVANQRPGNDGGVGNTLEDLLGIEENNLPLANAAEWELKCQRENTNALNTLFHREPSPTALKFVPRILLPNYGWRHSKAGHGYPSNEMSFRQTINGVSRTDRGFGIVVDRLAEKIEVSFDANAVDVKHREWRESVMERVGLADLEPKPYWGFDDLFYKIGSKLHNTVFVTAESKKEDGREYFRYTEGLMLHSLQLNRFIDAISKGTILAEFDARTGHNHGTKFRMRQHGLPSLYECVENIF